MKKNKDLLISKKQAGEAITMLTAYDFTTAQIQDEAGVDVILVGDSVGTNVLGYESEQQVTMADMVHHLNAVVRATKSAYIIVDMPYGSVSNPFVACENAEILINSGADCVKIEGWSEVKPVLECLTGKGIEVCGHIGYNPQIHGAQAKVFGKDAHQAQELISSSRVIEDAGAVMIVIEKIPDEIAAIISRERKIPVIGIGSGPHCDGQVLVVNDILGFGNRTFKHARQYMDFRTLALGSVSAYCEDVKNRRFPSEENLYHMNQPELQKISQHINRPNS